MNPNRKAGIVAVLERLEHRRDLLKEKCADSLRREYGLPEATAQAMVEQWAALLEALQTVDDRAWQEQAVQFGAWCAIQAIPFEAVMAQLHYYRRASMPLLVREYPGVEGYLAAHLALDEALTLLMGKIPAGYYRRS